MNQYVYYVGRGSTGWHCKIHKKKAKATEKEEDTPKQEAAMTSIEECEYGKLSLDIG
jgi:hypothetical protein